MILNLFCPYSTAIFQSLPKSKHFWMTVSNFVYYLVSDSIAFNFDIVLVVFVCAKKEGEILGRHSIGLWYFEWILEDLWKCCFLRQFLTFYYPLLTAVLFSYWMLVISHSKPQFLIGAKCAKCTKCTIPRFDTALKYFHFNIKKTGDHVNLTVLFCSML